MKKLFTKKLALAMLLCLLLTAISATALADGITAVEEHCYIRTAPGLNGEIIYTVPVGATATYLGDTSVDNRGVTWYKATYDGVTGWMSGLQISLSSDYSSYDDYGYDLIAVEEHCYIRTAPGLNGEIIYTVPVGAAAAYLGDTSEDNRGVTWYKADYNGIRGWMSSLQVKLSYGGSAGSAGGVITAVEEHCYIRTAPGLNGEIIYTVPVGGKATYLYDTSVDNRGVTWYKATYDGVTGWMSGLQIRTNF